MKLATFRLVDTVKFHIFGGECPFCGRWIWPWMHSCPTLAKMKPPEIVRAITSKVREVCQGDPADRDVHSMYAALDELEQKFPEDS